MPELQDDPEYQAFVKSMARFCHCESNVVPCDGVLAGGLCDGVIDEDWIEDDDENIYDDDN
jgi:hypothetical protein